jgi:hypothetical protein
VSISTIHTHHRNTSTAFWQTYVTSARQINVTLRISWTSVKQGCPCTWYEGIWESKGTTSLILNLSTIEKWSASHRRSITSGERALGTHLIGGQMGTRDGLDALVKRKISCPCQEQDHISSAIHPVVTILTDYLGSDWTSVQLWEPSLYVIQNKCIILTSLFWTVVNK